MTTKDIHTERPRAPSPWDELIQASTPPHSTDLAHGPALLPKLAPEIEQGSVEYKLKLLDPSPARFARLVTQLKWRLLEGHGQAYYEIGVADSGLLIGLSKPDLEKSLATLEEMAGDIGASVIVVKEIEVPEALVKLAERTARELAPSSLPSASSTSGSLSQVDERNLALRLGSWDRSSKREPISTSYDCIGSSTSDTDGFSDAPNMAGLTYTAVDLDSTMFNYVLADDEEAGTDGDLAVFSMDMEGKLDLPPTAPELLSLPLPRVPTPLLIDLSISSVFKPRTSRHRLPHPHPKVDRRQVKWERREKKLQTDWASTTHGGRPKQNNLATQPSHIVTTAHAQMSTPAPAEIGIEAFTNKAEKRRIQRDQRRDEKRQALLIAALATAGIPDDLDLQSARDVEAQVDDLMHSLQGLHVGLATPSAEDALRMKESNHLYCVDQGEHPAHKFKAPGDFSPPRETRHIAEVLVVRKLSVEEAYGDFGFEGFDVE